MEVRYICPAAYDSSVYLVNGKILIDAGMNSSLIIKQLEEVHKAYRPETHNPDPLPL